MRETERGVEKERRVKVETYRSRGRKKRLETEK